MQRWQRIYLELFTPFLFGEICVGNSGYNYCKKKFFNSNSKSIYWYWFVSNIKQTLTQKANHCPWEDDTLHKLCGAPEASALQVCTVQLLQMSYQIQKKYGLVSKH